jgi:thiamine biosynthesis lipoprotein
MPLPMPLSKFSHTPQLQRRRLLVALPLLVSGVAIAEPPSQADILRSTKHLMGTQVELCMQGRNKAQLQIAADAAFQEMSRLSQMMSRFHPSSVVNALHYASGIRPIPIPAELFRVLQMAKIRAQQSNGAFDPTIGAYADWQFNGTQNRSPDPRLLEQQKHLVNAQHLLLDEKNRTAFLSQRGMRLDLGGIAKLPILQAGLQVISDMGVEHVMLNGGGDVFVKGQLNGRAWRIGLRDPRQPTQILGHVELSDGIVVASGDYERYFMEQGQRQHHILNPQTGYPSRGLRGLALVVNHSQSNLTDINGLGAAMMVAGSKKAHAMLAKLAHIDALTVDQNQTLWLSKGMQTRLQHRT